MSNKIGLILALVIFLESYLFMYDLYMVQLVNSKLVMSSNYVNQRQEFAQDFKMN